MQEERQDPKLHKSLSFLLGFIKPNLLKKTLKF